MKILSLKLDEKIFNETEKMTNQLHMARNRYINEALQIYNQYNRRKLLKKQLLRESKLTATDAMDVLRDFENFADEN